MARERYATDAWRNIALALDDLEALKRLQEVNGVQLCLIDWSIAREGRYRVSNLCPLHDEARTGQMLVSVAMVPMQVADDHGLDLIRRDADSRQRGDQRLVIRSREWIVILRAPFGVLTRPAVNENRLGAALKHVP